MISAQALRSSRANHCAESPASTMAFEAFSVLTREEVILQRRSTQTHLVENNPSQATARDSTLLVAGKPEVRIAFCGGLLPKLQYNQPPPKFGFTPRERKSHSNYPHGRENHVDQTYPRTTHMIHDRPRQARLRRIMSFSQDLSHSALKFDLRKAHSRWSNTDHR